MKRLFPLLVFLFLPAHVLIASGGSDTEAGNGPLTVFAAASLTDVVGDLADWYEEQFGVSVSVNTASSSTLARQIAAGAEVNVYFTANPRWSVFLEDEGIIHAGDGTRNILCSNALVVIAPSGSSGDYPLTDAELLAIGDPEHVPAGVYAAESLKNLGLYSALESRIVPCPDVRAALRAVETGEADRGIVYATDASGSDVKVLSVLPQDSYKEIIYEAVLLNGVNPHPDAEGFLEMALGDPGRDILASYGFVPAEEAP